MNSFVCTDGSVGSGCGSDSDCASGKCAYDDINWNFFQCTDGNAGSICVNNADCSTPNICDTGTNTCVDGSNGASCTTNSNCSSGHCDSINGICTDGSVGTSCGDGFQCESSYCDSINDICSSGVPGSVCGGNSECDTYNCVSNVCSADLPALASGLVGYWPFENTSGTTATDLSGGGHNGTLSGGVTVNQTGKLGKAYSFNGSTGIVTVANMDSTLVGKNALTFSAWIKGNTFDNNKVILSNTVDNAAQLEFFLTPSTVVFCDYTTGDPSGWCPANFNVSATTGAWHLIVGVFQSGSAKVYIDGSLVGNAAVSGPSARQAGAPAKSLVIGGREVATYMERWNGMIDEVAIWNRPLAPAEITSLYNSGNGVSLTP
jgi:hypothetical protein